MWRRTSPAFAATSATTWGCAGAGAGMNPAIAPTTTMTPRRAGITSGAASMKLLRASASTGLESASSSARVGSTACKNDDVAVSAAVRRTQNGDGGGLSRRRNETTLWASGRPGPWLVPIEQIADSSRKVGLRQRLLDDFDAGIEAAMVNDGIARISRHEKDLHVRLAALHPPGQLAAIGSGQHHVGHEQIDLAAPAVDQSQRWRRIRSLKGVVFEVAQSLHD